MVNEHLDVEELNFLSNGKLTGAPLAKALLHVEECEFCQAKVTAPDAAQILNAIFAETPNAKFGSSSLGTAKNISSQLWTLPFIVKRPSLSFGFGAAGAAVLAIIVGTMWWFSSPFANSAISQQIPTAASSFIEPNEPDQTANGSPQVKETNIAAKPPTAVAQTETNLADNSKDTLRINQPRNASVSAEVSGTATNNPKTNQKTNCLTTNAARSVINAEQKELNQLLTKLPVVLASLRPSALNLRSGETEKTEDQFLLLTPRGEVVRETQPDFRWQSVEKAKRYKISIYDNSYNEIDSDTTEFNSYRLKSFLERDKTYLWQVTAQTADGEVTSPRPPATPVRFRVASDKTINLVERLKTEKSPRKLILVLLKEGLLSEAEAELSERLKRSPKNQLTQKLLNRVQALRNNATTKSLTQTVNSIM